MSVKRKAKDDQLTEEPSKKKSRNDLRKEPCAPWVNTENECYIIVYLEWRSIWIGGIHSRHASLEEAEETIKRCRGPYIESDYMVAHESHYFFRKESCSDYII